VHDARPAPEAVADHTVPRDARPLIAGPNRFKIGIFGANASGGMGGLTTAEGMIELASWAEVERLARRSEALGLEAFIPIARWKSPAGPGGIWGRQLETFTWAAGVAASTDRIQVFSTCHVPFVHPVQAAKMVATVDHISGGRVGLNVVAGYYTPEFEMFGLPLRDHDDRYRVADEWMGLLKRMWSKSEEPEFDFDGDYFSLRGVESFPKPVQDPYPVVMSAGLSPAGQAFALAHADLLFMAIQTVEGAAESIGPVAERARREGRENLALWAMLHIVCKDTEAEAREYVRYYAEEKADWETGVALMNIFTDGDVRSLGNYKENAMLKGLVQSINAIPVVGTPEQVVESLAALSAAGLDGAAIAMVDYDEGLDRLGEQILPLMRSAGLRDGGA
jgi:alkanesulfonate monooxygenase SsuD/methylene tetrahydromethanopterin reductase-like flavin-dependent oxidoreductase (luciferase family)